jgi:hypothetical protein
MDVITDLAIHSRLDEASLHFISRKHRNSVGKRVSLTLLATDKFTEQFLRPNLLTDYFLCVIYSLHLLRWYKFKLILIISCHYLQS